MHSSRISSSAKLLAAVSVGTWLITLILLWPMHSTALNWDEVDYVNAAKLGVWQNATEQGSLSAVEFARVARAKTSGGNYIPSGYDESRDPFLLRHFHPPLVVYLESLAIRWTDHASERVVRSVQLLGALALTVALFFSYGSLVERLRAEGLVVMALFAIWLSQPLFVSLQFHGWAAVWAVASCGFLSVWLRKPGKVTGVLVCLCVALSALTLETGAIVLIAAAICIAWRPPPELGKARWKLIAIGLAVTMIAMFVLWPGGIIKLSPLKAMAMYLYRIRARQEYGGIDYLAMLKSLAPILFTVVPGGIWVIYAHRREVGWWRPYLLVGLIYGIALVKFTIAYHYLLPAFAPLTVISAWSVNQLRSRNIRLLLTLAAVAILGLSLIWNRPTTDANAAFRRDLNVLDQVLRGRETLAVSGHVFSYYLGPEYSIRAIALSYDGALLERRQGAYVALTTNDIAGRVVIVMDRPGNEGVKERELQLLGRCKRVDAETVRVYDCENQKMQ